VGLLATFNYSLRQALEATFIEFNFEGLPLLSQLVSYLFLAVLPKQSRWHDIRNCRQFFSEFAQEKGFDALDPEAWYTTSLAQMVSKKVCACC